jgi:hypothetical protein
MMSPFVDDEMVHQISMKAAKSSWLFTRKDALEKLKVETFKNATPAEYFCINERLREGQLDERVVQNNEVLSTNDSDLHAKLYINQSGNKVFWFLGSANLSAPAFGRNTECLIELTSNDRSVFPLAIKNQLVSTDDKHKLFEKVDISRLEVIPADNFLNNHLRKLEFDLADCKISGKCNRIEGVTDQYRYDIKIDTRGKDWLPAFSVGIKPLFMQKTDSLGFIVNPGGFEPVNISETFPLTQLSRYFIFSISYKDDESLKKQFLLLGDIEVPKSRLAMVFSEVIDSTDKFLKFLMSVLNENEVIDSPTDTITSSSSAGNMEKYRNSAALLYEVPLYEHLLRTVSRNPFKLKSVEEAIMRIQEDKDSQHVIPVEFMEMWNVFKPFIQNDK